jgi:tryptophan 2,3-dioxygenase
MEREQFLKYRMALLPSSGFQSAQYRMIEIYATPLHLLVHQSERAGFSEKDPVEVVYEHMYWKKGATDLKTGEKTLTLKQFEYRYTPRFIRIANQVKDSTIYDKYLQLPGKSRNNKALIKALKDMDINANINWRLVHMGSAQRYLNKDNTSIEATGGTNWKQYLPPSFQKVVFFPEIFSKQELNNWGKQWVDHIFNPDKIKN